MHATNSAGGDDGIPIPEAVQSTKKCYLYGRLLIANIPAITAGMMLGWSSPVLSKLKTLGDQNPLNYAVSTTDAAIIGSALSCGAIFSPYLAVYSQEKIGRKYTLLSIAITFIIGLLTLSFARHVYIYHAARLFIGFAYGSVYTVLPIYLVEFAGNTNRGVIVNTIAICSILGTSLSLSIGPFTSIMTFSLICAAFPITFIILFMTLMPETPQDLLLMGKREKAKKLYFKMNLGNDFEDVAQTITTKIKTPYSEIFKIRSNIDALIITCMLMTFKQCSGVNVITSYSQSIFELAGDNLPPEIPPIILEVVAVFTTMMIPFFVENNGRRLLLKLSAAGMAVFFTIAGLYFYLEVTQDVSSIFWLPIVSMIGCKVSYSLGFGSVTWILMAELMPYNVKAAGSALTNSYCWAVLTFATFVFPIITEQAGMAVSFWMFAAINLLAFTFSSVHVPETKGKNAEEIQDLLSR